MTLSHAPLHPPSPTLSCAADVARIAVVDRARLKSVLAQFGLDVRIGKAQDAIPGSYWGESEAGLVRDRLYVRLDTPVHSALHEACHYICMDQSRRAVLDTDAGGDYAEEDAVCYLQILLAEEIAGFGRERMLADMDAWGYTFRLGSARTWFEQDAQDARDWLHRHGLVDDSNRHTWRIRL